MTHPGKHAVPPAGTKGPIAVLWGPAGPNIVRDIQRGIDKVLSDASYGQIRGHIETADAAGRRETKTFLRRIQGSARAAALIASCIELDDAEIAALAACGLPVVFIEGGAPARGCGNVSLDHATGARDAVHALRELGRSRVGCIGPCHHPHWAARARLDALRSALEKDGLALECEDEPAHSREAGAAATRRLLERVSTLDALIYAGDLPALGGLSVLLERGIDVPGRIAVIGADDSSAARDSRPTLSSVRQPFDKLGERGASMAIEAIERGATMLKTESLPARLILRGSCIENVRGEIEYVPGCLTRK